MNEKIQAILLKIIVELRKARWKASPDWEITLQSEGEVPLSKQIGVDGDLDAAAWRDKVETYINLKLGTNDEITYFPEARVYANIFIRGGDSKDIAYEMEFPIAFTQEDFKDDAKIIDAGKKIDRQLERYIEQEYSNYIDSNASAIKSYRGGGYKADEDPNK